MYEIKKTVWRSDDGQIYESHEEAEEADRLWHDENNEENVAIDVAEYSREGLRTYQKRMKQEFDGNELHLLVSAEKHYHTYMLARGIDNLFNCYFEALKQRKYIYTHCLTDREKAIVDVILKNMDRYAAYDFLKSRVHEEYEGIYEEEIAYESGV